MPRKKIEVYSGPGTSTGELIPRLRQSFHGAAINRTTAADMTNPRTLDNDTLAFILPGIIGENSPYGSDLGPQGNAAIRRYVEEGGIFIGICAGAYYACKDIIYDPPWRGKPKTANPGLDFFNALAYGPLPGLGVHGNNMWYSDCHVVDITYKDEKGTERRTGIAYGNGPLLQPFAEEDDDLEVIARYEDAPGKPIAVAVKKVGKGLAVFLGVLPYIGYDAGLAASNAPSLKMLMEDLRPHERGREDLWNLIVSRIKQHNADLGRVRLLKQPEPGS